MYRIRSYICGLCAVSSSMVDDQKNRWTLFFIRLFFICRLFHFRSVLLLLAFLLCFHFVISAIRSPIHNARYESLTLFVLSLWLCGCSFYFLCYTFMLDSLDQRHFCTSHSTFISYTKSLSLLRHQKKR